MTAVAWIWRRWPQLTLDELYDALALRAEVFVVEQDCPYQDADGLDRQAHHLLGHDATGRLVAVARVVDPGRKYVEPSIGRVATSPRSRGRGLGRLLMREAVARCEAAFPGQGIRISAQSHLADFYGSLGFEPLGEPYLEDDIPHIEMFRRSS